MPLHSAKMFHLLTSDARKRPKQDEPKRWKLIVLSEQTVTEKKIKPTPVINSKATLSANSDLETRLHNVPLSRGLIRPVTVD